MNNNIINLDPQFITGFVDGEGCFRLSITKNKRYKTGLKVESIFSIGLHEKDKALLELIGSFLGVGQIYKHGNDSVQLRVTSIKGLEVIINHFDKYPLITKKRADFELFKQAFNLIKNKDHLTLEGLRKLVAIKASLNLGLSDELKELFPNIKPAQRPLVVTQEIPDPNWLAGFVDAEGCFSVGISDSLNLKGSIVQLRFRITQHCRDAELLKSFIAYLGCGIYYLRGDAGDLVVLRLSDINEKIIPFFDKYPLLGVKALDFSDFKRAAKLITQKAHLTVLGLEEIRQIKSTMNRNRDIK
jgi:hypothetical protein